MSRIGGMSVIKVAMIGAGSVVFSKNLTGDILCYPEFRDATFSYMDVDADRLEVGASLCRKVGRGAGRRPDDRSDDRPPRGAARGRLRHQHGADRRVRLDAGRFRDPPQVRPELHHRRHHRPRRPVPRAAHVPDAHAACAATWRRSARGAMLLNYSNPMSMNMQTITAHQRRPRGRAVPQRAGHARPAHGLHRRRPGAGRLHLRRHQPHGVLPQAGEGRRRPLPAAVRGDAPARGLQHATRCASS